MEHVLISLSLPSIFLFLFLYQSYSSFFSEYTFQRKKMENRGHWREIAGGLRLATASCLVGSLVASGRKRSPASQVESDRKPQPGQALASLGHVLARLGQASLDLAGHWRRLAVIANHCLGRQVNPTENYQQAAKAIDREFNIIVFVFFFNFIFLTLLNYF